MAKKTVTNEELAGMIKHGFDGVDKRFEQVDKRFDNMEKRMQDLEQGQEDIKLRLTNVAYRFEIQELERRIILLEKKVGLSKK